jgi:hypothetical protein
MTTVIVILILLEIVDVWVTVAEFRDAIGININASDMRQTMIALNTYVQWM